MAPGPLERPVEIAEADFTPELEADIRRRERLLYRIGGYNHGESPCS
jgi:hypothetical protein